MLPPGSQDPRGAAGPHGRQGAAAALARRPGRPAAALRPGTPARRGVPPALLLAALGHSCKNFSFAGEPTGNARGSEPERARPAPAAPQRS